MARGSFMTDKLTLMKKTGETIDEIGASVQKNKIFVTRNDILIETGDLLQRRMSNGGEETYEVIDPGFYEGFGSIAANYQITVKKLGLPEAKEAVQNITYNISGNNARVNHGSVDNSVNVVAIQNDLTEQLSALRAAVEKLNVPDLEKQDAHDVVDAVEAQVATGNPKRGVIKALLDALPHVTSITTIVSTILEMIKSG